MVEITEIEQDAEKLGSDSEAEAAKGLNAAEQEVGKAVSAVVRATDHVIPASRAEEKSVEDRLSALEASHAALLAQLAANHGITVA